MFLGAYDHRDDGVLVRRAAEMIIDPVFYKKPEQEIPEWAKKEAKLRIDKRVKS